MKPNDITIPSIWDEYYRQHDRNHEQQHTTTEGDDNRSTSSRSLQADDDDDDAAHDSGTFSPSLNSTTTGSSAPVHPGSDPPLRSPRNRDFLSAYDRIVRHLHDNRRRRISNSSRSSPLRVERRRVERNWSSASLLELINAALAITADFSNDNDDATMIAEGVDGTGERNTRHDDDDGKDQR